MKTPAVPAGLLALLLALPCAAADAPAAETSAGKPAEEPGQGEKQARVWFDMLDTNHDGRLEWKEVRFVPWKPLRSEFHTADTNGDGFLTPDEIRVLAKRRVQERRARKAREAQEKAEKLAREQARAQDAKP